MAGYEPERGRGRERPDRHRHRGPGAYAGDDRSWASGSPRAAARGGRPRDRYREAGGRQAAPGHGGYREETGGYGDGDDAGGYGDGAGGYSRTDRYGRPAGGYRTEAGGYGYGDEAGGYGYRRAARDRRDDRPRRRDTTGGADGNERLTAITGATLLLLLAVEGFTILSIHQLLTLHFFLGMLLVGPVLLKAGSTVYRFARYYTGAPDYRRKGPPAPLLRLLGPVVLLLSLTVIGTGVMLAVDGPGVPTWMFLHKASFVLWFCAMTVHVLAYVWRLPQLISGDLATRAGARARDVLAGRPARWLLLTASILVGLLLAVSTVHLVGAWSAFTSGGFGGG